MSNQINSTTAKLYTWGQDMSANRECTINYLGHNFLAMARDMVENFRNWDFAVLVNDNTGKAYTVTKDKYNDVCVDEIPF